MFGRGRAETLGGVGAARGGVSWGGIFTGVVVAFGAMFLLSALAAGALFAVGILEGNLGDYEPIEPNVSAGIAFAIAQFLSYLWGGYTAGRMARGSGLLNGLLVPITAALIALLAGGVIGVLADLPFAATGVNLADSELADWGVVVLAASAAAMLLGGALGGSAGARWHTRLEQTTLEERHHELRSRHDEAPRDREPTPTDATTDRTRQPAGTGYTPAGAETSSSASQPSEGATEQRRDTP